MNSSCYFCVANNTSGKQYRLCHIWQPNFFVRIMGFKYGLISGIAVLCLVVFDLGKFHVLFMYVNVQYMNERITSMQDVSSFASNNLVHPVQKYVNIKYFMTMSILFHLFLSFLKKSPWVNYCLVHTSGNLFPECIDFSPI